jgi:ATP-binding cassette subfamily C protein
MIAYVPQDVFLFNDTVRANLAWGLPDALEAGASEPAMCAALERAGADFVLALPQGLDTPVGDGGVRLSGGERQRIALARALLRQPTLLILDEATSALDPDNETRIRDAIARLHGDLTVIVIGHRLSMVEQADQVIRLEQGRIAAQGTWEAVLGRPGPEPVQ